MLENILGFPNTPHRIIKPARFSDQQGNFQNIKNYAYRTFYEGDLIGQPPDRLFFMP